MNVLTWQDRACTPPTPLHWKNDSTTEVIAGPQMNARSASTGTASIAMMTARSARESRLRWPGQCSRSEDRLRLRREAALDRLDGRGGRAVDEALDRRLGRGGHGRGGVAVAELGYRLLGGDHLHRRLLDLVVARHLKAVDEPDVPLV